MLRRNAIQKAKVTVGNVVYYIEHDGRRITKARTEQGKPAGREVTERLSRVIFGKPFTHVEPAGRSYRSPWS